MPSNFLRADTGFPQLNGSQTTDEKLQVVTDYLYMLLEQLRYSLYNLEVENLNESAIDELGNIITEDLYIQLSDTNGNITNLQIKAEGLSSRLTDAEGNVSSLQQTATTLSSKMTSLEGDVSILAQTADSLTTRISSAEGNISTLTQTATSLTSRVSSAEGNISTLQQTATSLTSRVSTAEGNISTLQQTVDSFTLSVRNSTTSSTVSLSADGVTISSVRISFSGVVTFDDLETSGSTEICGDNITTGTISADLIDVDELRVKRLYGRRVRLYDADEVVCASFYLEDADSTDGQKIVIESPAIELAADDGYIYMENGYGNYIQIASRTINLSADTCPDYDGGCDLGYSSRSYRWNDCYLINEPTASSDRNAKTDISYGLGDYDTLFDALQPCTYKLINGQSGRTHCGMIAQDLETALAACGMDSTDLAAFIKTPQEDEEGNAIEGSYAYGIRYGEFIGMLIWQVQQLKARVAALEA